jgi:hypothetical protein
LLVSSSRNKLTINWQHMYLKLENTRSSINEPNNWWMPHARCDVVSSNASSCLKSPKLQADHWALSHTLPPLLPHLTMFTDRPCGDTEHQGLLSTTFTITYFRNLLVEIGTFRWADIQDNLHISIHRFSSK